MYWMTLTNADYRSYTDSIAALEKEKMELQARSIDAVAPGEQQPEVDHGMERQASSTGNFNNEFCAKHGEEVSLATNCAPTRKPD